MSWHLWHNFKEEAILLFMTSASFLGLCLIHDAFFAECVTAVTIILGFLIRGSYDIIIGSPTRKISAITALVSLTLAYLITGQFYEVAKFQDSIFAACLLVIFFLVINIKEGIDEFAIILRAEDNKEKVEAILAFFVIIIIGVLFFGLCLIYNVFFALYITLITFGLVLLCAKFYETFIDDDEPSVIVITIIVLVCLSLAYFITCQLYDKIFPESIFAASFLVIFLLLLFIYVFVVTSGFDEDIESVVSITLMFSIIPLIVLSYLFTTYVRKCPQELHVPGSVFVACIIMIFLFQIVIQDVLDDFMDDINDNNEKVRGILILFVLLMACALFFGLCWIYDVFFALYVIVFTIILSLLFGICYGTFIDEIDLDDDPPMKLLTIIAMVCLSFAYPITCLLYDKIFPEAIFGACFLVFFLFSTFIYVFLITYGFENDLRSIASITFWNNIENGVEEMNVSSIALIFPLLPVSVLCYLFSTFIRQCS